MTQSTHHGRLLPGKSHDINTHTHTGLPEVTHMRNDTQPDLCVGIAARCVNARAGRFSRVRRPTAWQPVLVRPALFSLLVFR